MCVVTFYGRYVGIFTSLNRKKWFLWFFASGVDIDNRVIGFNCELLNCFLALIVPFYAVCSSA